MIRLTPNNGIPRNILFWSRLEHVRMERRMPRRRSFRFCTPCAFCIREIDIHECSELTPYT